jgi:hypothetical protein
MLGKVVPTAQWTWTPVAAQLVTAVWRSMEASLRMEG